MLKKKNLNGMKCLLPSDVTGVDNNNVFDNLDYKPQNEIKNLKKLSDII